jgi:hypothetical protein
VRHFDHQNRHEIKDTDGSLWATVLFTDFETFSELSRRGFYLVDMSSEVWIMRRDGWAYSLAQDLRAKAFRSRGLVLPPEATTTPRDFAHAVGSFLLLTVWRPRTARENFAPGLRVMVDLPTKSQPLEVARHNDAIKLTGLP